MGTGQNRVQNLMLLLLEATTQLASCEENPGLDVAAATRACRECLATLKQNLANQGISQGGALPTGKALAEDSAPPLELKPMLQSLARQTDHCMVVLGRQLDRTGRELASLRGNQKAIRAYHGQKSR
jgi:hypothetical protein